jgi:ribosome-binding protein aMBF1 (putative translation factor)
MQTQNGRRRGRPPKGSTAAGLYEDLIAGNPEAEAGYEEVAADFEVAQLIYDARTAAGLTQKQLADRIGTTASAISRLEDADYEGHTLAMVRRVAAGLGMRLMLRFEPQESADVHSELRAGEVHAV